MQRTIPRGGITRVGACRDPQYCHIQVGGEQEGNKVLDSPVELSGGRAAPREGANNYLTIAQDNYTSTPRRGAHAREAADMHAEGPKFLMINMGSIFGAAFEAEGFLPVQIHQSISNSMIGGAEIS